MQREIFKALSIDNAIRWAIDCYELIGNPEFYIDKVANIEIKSYRGRVPYDIMKCTKLEVTDNAASNRDGRVSMITSGDPYLKVRNSKATSNFGYRIEGNYIYCDLENGYLQMAYKALPLDTDGYIMFPAVVELTNAISHYIKYKHLEILNDLEQVSYDKVRIEEREYLFYVGAAQAQFFLDNLDTAQGLINIQSQLLPDKYQHEAGYTNLGNREFIRKH